MGTANETSTHNTENEQERQEKLRHNQSFDPSSKSTDELDSMHPDSWAGGSIVPDAKKVARGEAPANRERGPNLPPPAEPEMPTSATRPWAPERTEGDSDVEYGGRDHDPHAPHEGRQAPPTTSPQRGEPSGRPNVSQH